MSISKMPTPPKLGKNILTIRKDRKWSLDTLAKKSGVSKAMLSQVEQEKTNPTLATLWKIAHGLNVPLEELLGRNETAGKKFEVCKVNDIPILYNDTKDCKFNILSTIDMQNVEIYMVELKKGGALISQKHYAGTEEILYVVKGTLEVTAGANKSQLKEGDVIRFQADVNHAIKNTSSGEASFFMVERLEA
ncbi:MAG: XRE family transcriptional regulator [Candidatus Firestonebacteria bacterium]